MLNDEIISELNILIESVKNDLINDSIGKETIENFMQDEQLVQRVSSCYKKDFKEVCDLIYNMGIKKAIIEKTKYWIKNYEYQLYYS